MKLVEIRPGMDHLFRKTLEAVLRFAEEVPGNTVPVGWYAESVAQLYNVGSQKLLLLAVLDDQETVIGHLLAMIEPRYGQWVAFVYQAHVGRGGQLSERVALLRAGRGRLEEWARAMGCRKIGFATPHDPRAMGRLFPGFYRTVTLLDYDLEG